MWTMERLGPRRPIRVRLSHKSILFVLILLSHAGCAPTGEPRESVASDPGGEAIPIEVARLADGVQAFDAEEYERARPLLQSEAAAGNPIAARYLGWMHLEGVAADRSLLQAGQAFHRGAVLGDAESQTRLAALYYQGLDFEANHQKARYWFRKAAGQGHAEAQYALYHMLLQGLGGEIRPGSALGWAWLAKTNGYTGGDQAWASRGMLVGDELADRIEATIDHDNLPQHPRFDTSTVNDLSNVPGTSDNGDQPDAAGLQLRVGDKGVVQIIGVREMDDVIPGDGVMNPWIAYDVVEITEVIKQISPQLHADIDLVKASVMTDVGTDGSKRLQINTRRYRHK